MPFKGYKVELGRVGWFFHKSIARGRLIVSSGLVNKTLITSNPPVLVNLNVIIIFYPFYVSYGYGTILLQQKQLQLQ